jgi:hypothetical protein
MYVTLLLVYREFIEPSTLQDQSIKNCTYNVIFLEKENHLYAILYILYHEIFLQPTSLKFLLENFD